MINACLRLRCSAIKKVTVIIYNIFDIRFDRIQFSLFSTLQQTFHEPAVAALVTVHKYFDRDQIVWNI